MHDEKNQGFSLVEIIIVLAIMMIFTVGAVGMTQYINYGNSKRCVREIEDGLNRVRMDSMSKDFAPILYLYRKDGKYYMEASTQNTLIVDELTNSKQIANGNIHIYKGNSADEMQDGDIIKLGYEKRSGAFRNDPY